MKSMILLLYFRALLYGGMKESQPGTTEIELQDTPSLAFSALLKYIYSGRMNLVEIQVGLTCNGMMFFIYYEFPSHDIIFFHNAL